MTDQTTDLDKAIKRARGEAILKHTALRLIDDDRPGPPVLNPAYVEAHDLTKDDTDLIEAAMAAGLALSLLQQAGPIVSAALTAFAMSEAVASGKAGVKSVELPPEKVGLVREHEATSGEHEDPEAPAACPICRIGAGQHPTDGAPDYIPPGARA